MRPRPGRRRCTSEWALRATHPGATLCQASTTSSAAVSRPLASRGRRHPPRWGPPHRWWPGSPSSSARTASEYRRHWRTDSAPRAGSCSRCRRCRLARAAGAAGVRRPTWGRSPPRLAPRLPRLSRLPRPHGALRQRAEEALWRRAEEVALPSQPPRPCPTALAAQVPTAAQRSSRPCGTPARAGAPLVPTAARSSGPAASHQAADRVEARSPRLAGCPRRSPWAASRHTGRVRWPSGCAT